MNIWDEEHAAKMNVYIFKTMNPDKIDLSM